MNIAENSVIKMEKQRIKNEEIKYLKEITEREKTDEERDKKIKFLKKRRE